MDLTLEMYQRAQAAAQRDPTLQHAIIRYEQINYQVETAQHLLVRAQEAFQVQEQRIVQHMQMNYPVPA